MLQFYNKIAKTLIIFLRIQLLTLTTSCRLTCLSTNVVWDKLAVDNCYHLEQLQIFLNILLMAGHQISVFFHCVACTGRHLHWYTLYKETQQACENMPCKIPFLGLLCNPWFQTFVLLYKCCIQEWTGCHHSLPLYSIKPWQIFQLWLIAEVVRITVSAYSILSQTTFVDKHVNRHEVVKVFSWILKKIIKVFAILL